MAKRTKKLLKFCMIRVFYGSFGARMQSTRCLAKPYSARLIGFTAALITLLPVLGCASADGSRSGVFQPYKFAIQQGNYITADAVKQIKVGMSPEQVRSVLGSPLVVDAFRTDRWDYVFHYIQPNGKTDTRRAAIHFAERKVSKVEATELPASEASDDPVLSRGRVR
jgi:outer membrane protein assembly factor BamE